MSRKSNEAFALVWLLAALVMFTCSQPTTNSNGECSTVAEETQVLRSIENIQQNLIETLARNLTNLLIQDQTGSESCYCFSFL